MVKRAKSSVDPRKYASHEDWKKTSLDKRTQYSYLVPKAKKTTFIDETVQAKKKIPGPPHYDNTGLLEKVHGFYGPSETKCSVIVSSAFEKKFIPGPNIYEGRGKGMSQVLKEKAKKFMYQYKPEKYSSGVKWNKTNEPAPTTYENAAAKEKCSEMRNTIKNTVPKAEGNNHIAKVLKSKKHVPGVGSYKTLETYKNLSSSVTSLRTRRH